MKHLKSIAVATCILLGSTVFAQSKFTATPGLDFRIGYGVVPVQNMQESFATELVPDLANTAYTDIKKKGSGMLSASVFYQTKGRLGVGVELVYGQTKTEFSYSNTATTTATSKWFTVMAKGSYIYFRDGLNVPNVELYGGVAVGSSFRDANAGTGSNAKNKNMSYLAYQLTPFGVRTGQKVGFWAEVGYGYKGLLNAGISVRL